MAYEFLLIQDVDHLGRKGQVVKAKPGYARNFLLPKSLAVVATPHALRLQKKLQDEREKQATIDRAEAERAVETISGLSLTIVVKVDQEGHMYGSVSIQEVIELLGKEGVVLEKKSILMKAPIKQTGIHQVPLKLKEGITGNLVLTIEPEGGFKKEEKSAE